MKRDPRLRPLSDDHHQALVLARRATRAASSEDPALRQATWHEVRRRFHEELAPHFAIEEHVLLPALERSGGEGDEAVRALAQRTRDEHAELRRLVGDEHREVADALAQFGTLLHDHVRFEERVLFMTAQDTLDDVALDAVAEACEESLATR